MSINLNGPKLTDIKLSAIKSGFFAKSNCKSGNSLFEYSVTLTGDREITKYRNKLKNTTVVISKPRKQPNDAKVKAIRAKVFSGRKLADVELAHIKEHAPELYAQAVKIEKERKEYEEKLKESNSKEEIVEIKLINGITLDSTVKPNEIQKHKKKKKVDEYI